MEIKKRDGRIKRFDSERIINAINKACIDVDETMDVIEVVREVVLKLLKLKIDIIEIETVQDTILTVLYSHNRVVHKAYKKYREERTEEREKNSKKERFYTEILQCSNVDNNNANVDQYSFSGRKYRIADMEQTAHALRNLVSKETRHAIEEGDIYVHDLSSYAIGEHNCLFSDNSKLINETGFRTRNGDVRPANSFSTACQLLAVIFQVQSQVQFGGVASCGVDFELEPSAHKSFVKHFKEGFYEKYDMPWENGNRVDSFTFIYNKDIHIDNKKLEELYPEAYGYAIRHLEKEGRQSAQGLFHNLNTLESRAGSQVPFTSLNYGRNTSTYGKLINKWLLDASLGGIGKFNRTSIFPISIFQYKKGVNDKEGTPNYDLKLKAIESLSKRIYPNWANGDWKQNIENPDDYTTFMATMGCRTLLGKDIHTGSYSKTGRGNISPVTIILPKIGLDYGIKLGKRDKADIDGFMKQLDKILLLTRQTLIARYEYICSQSPKSAMFMYENGTMMDVEKCEQTVREAIKHGTNAIGIIGMAECCNALFGQHHGESLEAYKFALDVVKHIDKFCTESSKEFQMNFSTYFTPAENLCKTARNTLELYYGKIEGVTDRPYLTNSIHIPVWYKIDAYSKLLLEAPFTQYGKGGCITYVELSTNAVYNPKGLEKIIDYAMDLNIPYVAFNFPIDTCDDCGFSSQITTDLCPVCGSNKVQRLKRVTGYLTTDYRNFNGGKIAEVDDRVTHEYFNPLTLPIIEFATQELLSYGIEVPNQ